MAMNRDLIGFVFLIALAYGVFKLFGLWGGLAILIVALLKLALSYT